MDLEHLKSLLALLAEHDVSEFKYEDDDQSIRLRLGPPPATVPPMGAVQVAASAPLPVAAVAAAAPAAAPAASEDAGLVTIESPMVGTFYRSSAPDAPPYVEVGAQVSKGAVLCIVEAMKLMNEIEAEQSGTIAEILVENGQPVQFGQALFKLRV
ncbi:MAG: acetyl-CoA carboxylase biotin carboxyl carrier protein [Alphaproteobacteria bacterium]|nr:acetyl-CoA carboxylase biotin carboxyl carrier protein [Alphaproteobacteria bacterium]MCB9693477.1 acetyl-CoA carboxylase biotin carboxyl carrier protein [Alphaproteobacteria bacterium]